MAKTLKGKKKQAPRQAEPLNFARLMILAGVFGLVLYGSTSRNTGSTGGTETQPKNIAMLYCIKF